MNNKILSAFLFLLILSSSCGENSKKEIAEKEKSVVKKPKTTIAEIEEGIKAYIEAEMKESDGYFYINEGDKELKLQLVRVHTEYLSNLGPKRHFACVDLADIHGDVYDVDFFMEGEPGSMKVTETSVHKLNGRPFYAWKQKKDKTWERVAMEETTNALLGVIEGEDAFEFYYQTTLPQIKDKAHMWIPIAKSDAYQTIEVVSVKAPGKKSYLQDKDFGNKILHLELKKTDSELEIEIIYQVTRKEKSPYEDPQVAIDRYLDANLLVPTDGKIKETALTALGSKRSEGNLMRARALYDYIIDNMRYMKNGVFGKGDALYACDSKTGNCTEFHSLFIAMARSIDIPARFAIGAAIPADRNEGGIDGYHCWAEFYAEGKWWPIDISEANKYSALATYYFGRHPANRIEFTVGRDLVFDPGPSSGPINFLAYPYLEINGEQTFAPVSFSFLRK